MILQTLILAVACTGVIQNSPTSHTLYYDVGRGLIGNMVLSNDDSSYINTYIDFDNFRVIYTSGQITGMYCDNVDLIYEVYDETDTLVETIYDEFDGSYISSINLYGVDIEFENFGFVYSGSYYFRQVLYINDVNIGYEQISFEGITNAVVPNIYASLTFLDDNFYTYYDYNVGSTSYQSGYDRGYNVGYSAGVDTGYSTGYVNGFDDASQVDATMLSIFTGILSIGMLPLEMFMTILNFEILGINISNIVFGFMTAYMILFVVRLFTGGNKSS